jgi:hypothetical protein
LKEKKTSIIIKNFKKKTIGKENAIVPMHSPCPSLKLKGVPLSLLESNLVPSSNVPV